MNSNIKIKKGQIEDYAVQKTGDQTIGGLKTFVISPQVSNTDDAGTAVNLGQARNEISSRLVPLNESLEDLREALEQNKQIGKVANFTLEDLHHKVTIFCNSSTSTINITVPDTLRKDFVCFLFNQGSATVNVLGSGTTVLTAPEGTVLDYRRRGMIEHIMGTKNFLVTGEFS